MITDTHATPNTQSDGSAVSNASYWHHVRSLPQIEKDRRREESCRRREARAQARRRELSENSPRGYTPEKQKRIDDGLVVMDRFAAHLTKQEGKAPAFERDEIAAFCGCTPESIRVIEARALEKLGLRFPQAREFLEILVAARQPSHVLNDQ